VKEDPMRSFSRIALAALVFAACPARVLANEAWTALTSLPFAATSIAVDPGARGTLWAAAGFTLHRSVDRGKSWTEVDPGCPNVAWVATAPSAPGTVYVSSRCGYLRSGDGGGTWQTLADPISPNAYVYRDLLIDPQDSSTLYLTWYNVGTDDTGIFKSMDGGRTWAATALDPAAGLASLGIDPSARGTLYVGTWRGAIWKSVNAGNTWRLLPGPDGSDVSRILVDARPGSVYATTLGGLYRSDDGGETWTAAGLNGSDLPTALVLDISTYPVTMYAGTKSGVLRSRDAGQTWESLRDELTRTIDGLVLAGGRAPVLYALSANAIYSRALDPPSVSYLVPSSAHSRGANGAFYTTDLAVANPGAADATVTLRFLGHDADGTAGPTTTLSLAAGRAVTYADVLGSLFGVESGYGALQLTSDSPALRITAFTSTPSSDGRGRVGQGVPAFDATRLARPGSPSVLVGLRDDASTRTNLVLANATQSPASVVLMLVGPDGSVLGTTNRDLPPLGMTQVPSVVAALGGAPTGEGYLVVAVATPGGAVAAYASVVDNGTNDPRTVLP
jgi:photosystem II stability/assembly factor-like uncharacterized protein